MTNRTLGALALAGALVLSPSVAQATPPAETTFVTWVMPGSTGQIVWPQYLAGTTDERGWCQVDEYKYEKTEHRALVDNLIAGGVLNSPADDGAVYVSHEFVAPGVGGCPSLLTPTPTKEPTSWPTPSPSPTPTADPSPEPTASTPTPTVVPSPQPSESATPEPSTTPSEPTPEPSTSGPSTSSNTTSPPPPETSVSQTSGVTSLTCSDFATQEQAQVAFEAGHVYLDGDSNGVACQETSSAPMLAATGTNAQGWGLAAALLALGTGMTFLARKRKEN